MTTQRRNAEQVRLLSADFIRKMDNAYLWAMTPGAYLMLPNLRAFFPMSAVNATPRVWSLVNGAELVINGSPTFGAYGLAPYCALTGSGYLRSPVNANLETTGALTVGLWVSAAAFNTPLVSMWRTSGEGWQLYTDADGLANFKVEGGGGSTVYTATSADAMTLDTWTFVVGRYTPSTELAVCVNGVWATNTTSIPATITDPNERVTVGALSDGSGTKLTGNVSLAFLCHAALSDIQVAALYGLTRVLFGV